MRDDHLRGGAAPSALRFCSQPRRDAKLSPNSGLIEPLRRLKYESWHKRGSTPFRAGQATTSWQLAQAHTLFGKRHARPADNTLIVLALGNKPGANLGWALAALRLQCPCQACTPEQEDLAEDPSLALITDITFSDAAPQERKELLEALLETARLAVAEAWSGSLITLADSLRQRYASWLDPDEPILA